MKWSIIILTITLLGCQTKTSAPVVDNELETVTPFVIPETSIDFEKLVFLREEGVWKLDGEIYSGYAIKHYQNGALEAKIGFANGKKNGQAVEYFEDGHLKSMTSYHENLMHGEVKNWSGAEEHPILAIRNFYQGKPHGTHKKWYPNGNVFKIVNYNMGKEEGLQQAFLENGKLYANYEAHDGRSFGLKRSMLCFELEDGKLKSNEEL